MTKAKPRDDPIQAELFGGNECRYRGITTRGSSPLLAMCRALIGAGYNPSRPLHVYRGKALALTARSIGDGAKLTVRDSSTGRPKFRKMTPQEWARAQEAHALPLVANPGLDLPEANAPIGEAAAPLRRGG
jgi:hypothetical protein